MNELIDEVLSTVEHSYRYEGEVQSIRNQSEFIVQHREA